MKLQHIAILTISSLLVGVSGLAAADVTVYGKANVSLNKDKSEDPVGTTTNDTWTLNSNASRLGVKGDSEIEGNLKAIYKMEFEVAMDDGDTGSGTAFKQRNIYVGLEGDFGQVIAGEFDDPTKAAQGGVDRFNDLPGGDMKGGILYGENRLPNLIQYTTPDMSGFTAAVALQPGEQDGQTPSTDKNGVSDGISGSIKYSADNFWVAVAMDSDIKDKDLTRFVAEFTADKLKVGALVQNVKDTVTDVKSNGYLVSAQYGVSDKVALKAQYSANKDKNPAADLNTKLTTIGADYKLAKKAKLYAYASNGKSEDGGVTTDTKDSTVGIGAEVKF